MIVRAATPDDAEAIAAIYAHHVAHGTASFDTVPRSLEETAAKIVEHTAHGWPFLVVEIEGAVAGYAYASRFRDRPAYRYACEDSIYVDADRRGQGVGMALLTTLIERAEACGFRQMIAVVGGGETASVAVHARCGFAHAGRMRSVGRKFGQWLDTVYMQRSLGPGDGIGPPEEPA